MLIDKLIQLQNILGDDTSHFSDSFVNKFETLNVVCIMQLQGEILQEEITKISPNRRRRVLMGISFLTFGGCKLCTRGKDATRNHYQYTALEC